MTPHHLIHLILSPTDAAHTVGITLETYRSACTRKPPAYYAYMRRLARAAIKECDHQYSETKNPLYRDHKQTLNTLWSQLNEH